MALAIESPSPAPSTCRSIAPGARYIRSNSRARSASLMPMPGVGHGEHRVGALGGHGDADLATGRAELARVDHQVLHDAHEPVGVTPHRHFTRRLEAQREARPVGEGLVLLDHLGGHRGEVDELERVPGEVLVDERDGQQVVDQPQLAARVATYDLHQLACLWTELVLAQLAQQLEVAEDRGERCPELVGDVRDQLVPHPVGLLLEPDPGADVAQEDGDLATRPAERRDGQLDGERVAVPVQRHPCRGQLAVPRRARISSRSQSGTSTRMWWPASSLAGVAEHLGHSLVEEEHGALGVEDHRRVRCRVEQLADAVTAKRRQPVHGPTVGRATLAHPGLSPGRRRRGSRACRRPAWRRTGSRQG